jgi:uncharacterized protein
MPPPRTPRSPRPAPVPTPRPQSPHPRPLPPAQPLSTAELDTLDEALAARPGEALDVVALDGYLCGVLLQPGRVPPTLWLPAVFDVDAPPGAAMPADAAAARIGTLVQRRHAELDAAIAARQWFDPWVFELDDPALSPHAATLPWVAGFAAAMARFPALMQHDEVQLLEPLAVLYAAFDPQDLEDADALLAEIQTLEPPATLAEAVEDLVTSVLRLADVTRPIRTASGGRQPRPHVRRTR